jgi:hypothetical protein
MFDGLGKALRHSVSVELQGLKKLLQADKQGLKKSGDFFVCRELGKWAFLSLTFAPEFLFTQELSMQNKTHATNSASTLSGDGRIHVQPIADVPPDGRSGL